MTVLAAALELASLGFHVFPLVPNSKVPSIEDFPNVASRDPNQIRTWWLDPVLEIEQPYNVGISTTRFGDNEALLVIDVDNKDGKNGDANLAELVKTQALPRTFEQKTPTGGRHIFFRVPRPVKQGANVLGRGLDIRSRGGYVVGAGSCVDAGSYSASIHPLHEAPEWLVRRCGSSELRNDDDGGRSRKIRRAEQRATHYLIHEAPLAVEGEAGDQTTYKVAARVKDFGVDSLTALELMFERWNNRCSPPWSFEELKIKVQNAYAYGLSEVGSDDPATQFTPVVEEKKLHPFEALNKEFAYILLGGKGSILWETTDHNNYPCVRFLDEEAFHKRHVGKNISYGKKSVPITEAWMMDEKRRSYDGLCFMPGKKAPSRFYNLWQGFTVSPTSPGEVVSREAQKSVDSFLEHAELNVCGGDKALTAYLLTYFAHLIQKPWEKPLVALVFKGLKGVGKNALIERVGHLLGDSFAVVAERRYLIGNFNSILENKLALVLDEAFWSGDKQAEGILKDLITGSHHRIERKGKEPYRVENCLRTVVLGNEDWLIPATADERRYAVFSVGNGRRQDRKFFREMREGMEAGGYSLLLRYLMDYDISKVDVTHAPTTKGLLEQKERSLDPFDEWWKNCLNEGRIISSDFGSDWPKEISKDRFRDAFIRHAQRERNIHGRLPTPDVLGALLKKRSPSVFTKRKRDEGERVYVYCLPSVLQARKEWEAHIGQKVEWEFLDEGEEEELIG